MERYQVVLVGAAATAALALACSSQEPAGPNRGGARAPLHGGHEAAHGGVLTMVADIHFETVLDPGGRHRVYWSDGLRRPMAASAIEAVTLTVKRREAPPERLTLRPDPSDTFWVAAGTALIELHADAEVTFNRRGEPAVTMALERPRAAHAGADDPAH